MPPILQPNCSLSFGCRFRGYVEKHETSQIQKFQNDHRLLQLQNYSVGAHNCTLQFGGRTVVISSHCLDIFISSGNHCQSPSLLSVKTQMRRTGWEIHGDLDWHGLTT